MFRKSGASRNNLILYAVVTVDSSLKCLTVKCSFGFTILKFTALDFCLKDFSNIFITVLSLIGDFLLSYQGLKITVEVFNTY